MMLERVPVTVRDASSWAELPSPYGGAAVVGVAFETIEILSKGYRAKH
jgi:hypothetical protein